MSYLHDCKYNFGTRFGCITEPIRDEEDGFGFGYHPMFYRFHRYIPRRRMWRFW
jgi:hypothetical protein